WSGASTKSPRRTGRAACRSSCTATASSARTAPRRRGVPSAGASSRSTTSVPATSPGSCWTFPRARARRASCLPSFPGSRQPRQVRSDVAFRRLLDEAGWALALEVPGEGDVLGDAAVQRLGDGVAEFQARQQAHQLGILVDRHLVLAGDGEDRLGQLVVALGGQAGGAGAVVGEGDGLAGCLVLLHAV